MLSGDILQDGKVVGHWRATKIRSHDGFANYHCIVLTNDGHFADWELRGHAETNTMLSLVARVLSDGQRLLQPISDSQKQPSELTTESEGTWIG